MILDELIERLEAYQPREAETPLEYTLEISDCGIGPFSKEDLKAIVETAALSIAVCEDQTRVAIADPTPDSTYRRMISKARELGLEREAGILEQAEARIDLRVPFFGMSRGAELEIAAKACLTAKYFNERGRTGPKDIDLWLSYYRTSEGLTIALSRFSPQADKDKDPVDEIFKVSLADRRAMHTSMVAHACLPELGIVAESTQIGSYAGTAIYAAILNGPLLRGEEMSISSDSAVHLLIGDAGLNEVGYASAMRGLATQVAANAVRRLGLSDARIQQLTKAEQREILKEAVKHDGIKLEVDVLNNFLGISTRSTFMHPFGDVLSDFAQLEDLGVATTHRYETIDFLQLLETQVRVNNDLRRDVGIVAVETRGRRPGGHTQSNFYGQGLVRVPEGIILPERLTLAEADEIRRTYSNKLPRGLVSGLTWLDQVYHNNYEPLEFALRTLIDLKMMTRNEAITLIKDAQKHSLQSLARVIETHEKKTYTAVKSPQDNQSINISWSAIANDAQALSRREQTLRVHIPSLEEIMQFRGIRSENIKERGIIYPEQFGLVEPLAAENLAILEMFIATGNLRGTGQDIHTANPQDIRAVMGGKIREMGGIDKVTAMIQTTLEKLYPGRGRYHLSDVVGINEEGIFQYCLAAALLFREKGAVFGEIQFLDYLSQAFGMDNISTAFQRSNGQERLPIIFRTTFGFFRGKNMDVVFDVDGAGGMYHAATNINRLRNAYPGWNIEVPNTTRDIVMAYRRGLATRTPTFVLLSTPVMRAMPIGGFEYKTSYPAFNEIDPFETLHVHLQKEEGRDIPLGSHKHVILTYGEYVPVCYAVAERVKRETGIHAAVVDYSTIEPRDRRLTQKILEQYQTPNDVTFTIVSPEDTSGFGTTILSDVLESGVSHKKINTLLRKEGAWPEWRGNQHIHPHPNQIYRTIVENKK